MDVWIDAFAALAVNGRMPRAEARAVAEEQVALLEGSLVLAQVTGDTRAFGRAIERLPDRLVPRR